MKGSTRRSEVTFTVEGAQVTLKAAGVSLAGSMTLATQATDDLEILEVRDGQVHKARLNHVLDKAKTTLRLNLPDGTAPETIEEENGGLHGRVENIEFAGQWKRTLEGPAPTPEQTRLMSTPPIDDMNYPTALRVGESWTETGPELRRWLGSDAIAVRGEMKNTLLAVESQQGEKVAVIESIGEIEATVLDAQSQEMKMSLGLQGKIRRSLDRGFDLAGSAEGAIKIAGDTVQDGIALSMAITGRVRMTLHGSLR